MPKHYFVADIHLGLKVQDLRVQEKVFVDWLDSIAPQAAALYLLGDIFDFWREYKYVVPKGYVRVLGTLAQWADRGVPIHFFKGNHDQWTFGYLEKELGIKVHDKPLDVQIGKARFYLGHDQGGGSGAFGSRFLQQCFGMMHPRWGMGLGHTWSARHRTKSVPPDAERDMIESRYRFAVSFPHPVDYFLFGHLHTPFCTSLPGGSKLIGLGAWIDRGEYGVFDEHTGNFEVQTVRYGR